MQQLLQHSPCTVKTARNGAIVAVEVREEIDLTTIGQFLEIINQVISCRPRRVIVDLTTSGFVSVAGYTALGKLSDHVPDVLVRSSDNNAPRILSLLGYTDVICTSS
jgi:anti-anti-sigma regulatory factor